MGPGFHSLIEANIFEKKIPSMQFWNQPKEMSFSGLVKTAQEAFLSLKADKVDLYAHSFGAQLALMLIKQFPSKIGKVTILNSATHPFNCFLNVGLKLKIVDEAEASRLRLADTAAKMETIFKIASSPDFSSVYWFSKERQHQFEGNYFSQFPPVDLNVFASVFSDFLTQREKLWGSLTAWGGPVKIIYSENDILLNYSNDVAPWAHVFPKASFECVQGAGHYAHLESQSVADKFFFEP